MSKVILLFALPPLQSIISSPVSCHGRLWEQCGSLPVLGNFTFAGWGQDSVSSALFLLCVSLHGVFHRSQPVFKFPICSFSLHHINNDVLDAPCWFYKEPVFQALGSVSHWWGPCTLTLQQSLGRQLHVPLWEPLDCFHQGYRHALLNRTGCEL